MRGPRRQRRLDPLLVLALTDLDQAGVVQPVDRNVAGLGRTYQFHGRGTQSTPFAVAQKIFDVFAEVGSLILGAGDGREHVAGNLAGLYADVLVVVAVEHFDEIWIVRRFRPRQRAVNTGGMLKRQGQPCDQIADGQPLVGAQRGKPLGLFLRKPRQHGCQAVDHARPQTLEGFGIARFHVQLEPDHRLPRMDVRTDINRN